MYRPFISIVHFFILASAALPVYNIPNTSPHRCLEPKKAPLRLTSAGESVTIKAQREVLPIDGQPRFRLLQKSNRVPQPKGGYFFVLFM